MIVGEGPEASTQTNHLNDPSGILEDSVVTKNNILETLTHPNDSPTSKSKNDQNNAKKNSFRVTLLARERNHIYITIHKVSRAPNQQLQPSGRKRSTTDEISQMMTGANGAESLPISINDEHSYTAIIRVCVSTGLSHNMRNFGRFMKLYPLGAGSQKKGLELRRQTYLVRDGTSLVLVDKRFRNRFSLDFDGGESARVSFGNQRWIQFVGCNQKMVKFDNFGVSAGVGEGLGADAPRAEEFRFFYLNVHSRKLVIRQEYSRKSKIHKKSYPDLNSFLLMHFELRGLKKNQGDHLRITKGRDGSLSFVEYLSLRREHFVLHFITRKNLHRSLSKIGQNWKESALKRREEGRDSPHTGQNWSNSDVKTSAFKEVSREFTTGSKGVEGTPVPSASKSRLGSSLGPSPMLWSSQQEFGANVLNIDLDGDLMVDEGRKQSRRVRKTVRKSAVTSASLLKLRNLYLVNFREKEVEVVKEVPIEEEEVEGEEDSVRDALDTSTIHLKTAEIQENVEIVKKVGFAGEGGLEGEEDSSEGAGGREVPADAPDTHLEPVEGVEPSKSHPENKTKSLGDLISEPVIAEKMDADDDDKVKKDSPETHSEPDMLKKAKKAESPKDGIKTQKEVLKGQEEERILEESLSDDAVIENNQDANEKVGESEPETRPSPEQEEDQEEVEEPKERPDSQPQPPQTYNDNKNSNPEPENSQNSENSDIELGDPLLNDIAEESELGLTFEARNKPYPDYPAKSPSPLVVKLPPRSSSKKLHPVLKKTTSKQTTQSEPLKTPSKPPKSAKKATKEPKTKKVVQKLRKLTYLLICYPKSIESFKDDDDLFSDPLMRIRQKRQDEHLEILYIEIQAPAEPDSPPAVTSEISSYTIKQVGKIYKAWLDWDSRFLVCKGNHDRAYRYYWLSEGKELVAVTSETRKFDVVGITGGRFVELGFYDEQGQKYFEREVEVDNDLILEDFGRLFGGNYDVYGY